MGGGGGITLQIQVGSLDIKDLLDIETGQAVIYDSMWNDTCIGLCGYG